MNSKDDDFPEELLQFIQHCVPTIDAAEMLVLIASQPDRKWKVDGIVADMKNSALTPPNIRRYFSLFGECALLTKSEDGAFKYEPASPALNRAVDLFTNAYNRRPVTLIQLIYSLAENKIQSFADAFKIGKD